MALQNPLLPVNNPSTDTMSAPAADSLSDHEGVRRIMKGIARSHGTAQKQAKPLTAKGPGRRQGHRNHQAPPGRQQEAGIGRKSLLEQQGKKTPIQQEGSGRFRRMAHPAAIRTS